MEDPRPAGLPSLDELAAEVVALRQRLNDLERQMQLLGGRPTVTLPEPHGAPLAGLRRGTADQPAAAAATPFAQVLTADEDTAKRHLEQLRAAIVRLREERAQAAAEFRNLTKPLGEPEQAPAEPGPASPPAADVSPATEAPPPPPVAAPPLFVVGQRDTDAELSTLSLETATVAPRVAETAVSHVRLDVDDVPDVPEPAGAGEEAWREVRQSVLQSEAWRAREEPRRRWLPTALAFAGAAVLALAAYALWPARAVPAGTESVESAEAPPPAPVQTLAQRPAAPPAAASTAVENAAGQAPLQGTPIGTSGTNGAATGTLPSPAEPSPAPPAPAPAATTASRIEIRTSREVWMRTTVDDGAPVERLVPAGRTLQFNPAQVFRLRAGDAGGVRVVVDGEDLGVLGGDGQVVNRRYELASKKTP